MALHRFSFAGLLAGLTIFAGSAFAQASGTIHGTVTDSTGAVVPGVAVTITNTGTNQARSLAEGRTRGEQIQSWFNPKAFKVNAIGTIGQIGRNTLRSAGAWNADYSLFKQVSLLERARIQFRGEFFNLFNHTRLGGPNTTVVSTAFGRITSAYEPRIVQLGLKLIF